MAKREVFNLDYGLDNEALIVRVQHAQNELIIEGMELIQFGKENLPQRIKIGSHEMRRLIDSEETKKFTANKKIN